MKHFITLLFIILATFSVIAQDRSALIIGAGYPLFMGTKSDDPHYDYVINKANYNLFLEKAILLLKKYPEIRLTHGLAYSQINESYKYEGLGGGGKGEYEHSAFSAYLKLLYEIDRQPYVVTDYYFGIQMGYYFHSKTTGSRSSWQLNPDGDNYSNSKEIDRSGQDFFHTNYFGIIAGMQLFGDKETFIQPKIELAFYPSFATANSYYQNGEEKKNMFQISVSAGIGNSKKKHVE